MEIKRIAPDQLHLVTDLFDKYRVFDNKPSDITLAAVFIKERIQKDESVIFVALDTQNGRLAPVGLHSYIQNIHL